MKENGEREDALARMLREPLTVTHVERSLSTSEVGAHDEVVTTSRLILILRGEMEYTIEHATFPMGAGTQFFVPAWVRRVWTGARGQSREIIWFEFDDPSADESGMAFFQRRLGPADAAREKSRYLELARWFSAPEPTELHRLGTEGLLKAMLARFWTEAEPPEVRPRSFHPPHPCVQQALRWLGEHFHEWDVLEALYAMCGATPNYFRRCFKEALLCSPHEYIERLRLRRARFLLLTTGWQQKQIAQEVGYDDPLYFSRLYHRFWGHSPSEEPLLGANR